MKKKLPIALLIAVALTLTSVAVAHAEWGNGRRDKGDKQKVRDRVEFIKMWKLTEALDLDQEMATKLFPLMNEFDQKQRDLRKKRSETMKQMGEELEKDASDPAALRSLIDQFKENERDMTNMRIQRLDALSKVLTDEQVATMIALAPKFESRVKELIGEARGMQRERRRWSEEGRRRAEEGRRWSEEGRRHRAGDSPGFGRGRAFE